VVDDQPGFHDPRKMMASVIEANAHLVTISTQEHNNLIGAINRAHLSVDETVYEPSRPAMPACCRRTARGRGAGRYRRALDGTGLLLRRIGAAGHFAAICGDHFSRDLAHACAFRSKRPRLVKHEFGGAVADGTAENSVVELPFREGTRNGRPREVPRKFVNEILESRAVELFEMVRAELARVVCSGLLRAVW
jgi:cell division protein FtsA